MTKRLLIIDDDEAVRFAFQLALEDLPYQVNEAADGETGVGIALTEPIDAVFLDLRMPGINGIEALRRIRAVKPDLLIYIVTAFHREFLDDLVTARGEGLAFELLRKPVERDQIIEIVTSALPD
jgi:CheY-like chemotaxis protein